MTDTVGAIVERVRSGASTAVETAERALGAYRDENEAIGAFLHVDADRVMDQARAVDARRARGDDLGPLAGVPVAIKDAICTRDLPTTAASRALEGYTPPYDATVIERLRRADAIIFGKTNMDEFCMGSSSEFGAFGPVRNPVDHALSAGGSSGGSAAAVAADIVPLALGSDTGGSIRQPAAFTGTFGLKPTYGRVSRFGLIAFASSLDQIGPIASDHDGLRRALAVIGGHDPRDATSDARESRDLDAPTAQPNAPLRIGIDTRAFDACPDTEVSTVTRALLESLATRGHTLVEVDLPELDHVAAIYYILATAEASSNLARYDGIRYGHRAANAQPSLDSLYGSSRREAFGREVKRRILLGTFVLSAGYYDAFYAKAQRARAHVREAFRRAFDLCDVLASPTAPTPPFPLQSKTVDPIAMYECDRFTLPASLAGLPALSIPCPGSRLPVGLHLTARAYEERALLSLAREAAAPSTEPS